MPTAILNKNVRYYRGSYGHLLTRINEVDTTHDVDILFLGSSHAYRGFDTRTFSNNGFKNFNLGSNAQTPIQTEFLIERYIEQLNPKLVIYEVYPATFENKGVESTLDIIANTEIDINTYKMTLQVNNLIVYNTFVYAFFKDILGAKIVYQEDRVKEKKNYIDTYEPGGYVERKLKIGKTINVNQNSKRWDIKVQLINSFENILKKFKNRSINFILVQAPYNSNLYNSYTNNTQVDSLFSSYGPYYNFNKLMKLDDSLDFYDASHLNQIGVEKFNERIISLIRENDLL